MPPRVEQVRLGEVASQGTRAIPGGTATAADFGGAAAAQLIDAGAKLERTAETLQRRVLQVATENNETAAKQADTEFNTVIRNTLFDPEKGYFTLKGKAALDSYRPTEDQLRKLQAEQAAKITNPEARKMFSEIATRRLDAAFDSMAKHSTIERRQWMDGVSMARAMNAGDDAVAYAEDAAKREAALNVGRQEIINSGRDLNEDPEITNRKLREYDTKAYKGVIERMITTDPMAAQRFYEENKHRIDGQQQIGLERTLKEATGRRRAEDDANSIMSPVPTGERGNNIGNIVKSKYQYAGGKGKSDGPFETFTTPEHGVAAAAQTIDAKAKQNGGAITPLELIGGNSKVGGWAPADDGKDPLLKGNNPKSYAAVIAKAAGIGINDPLPLNDPEKMAAVLKAMNRHEHGKQTVPDAAYAAGLKIARGEAAAPDGAKPAQSPEAKPVKTSTDPHEVAREIEANFAGYVEEMKRLYPNDPERRDAGIAILRQRKALAEEAYTAQLKVDTENAWKIAITPDPQGVRATSIDAVPPALWIKLTPQTQEALTRQFAHNLKGTQIATDQNAWYEIQRGLSSDDPNVRQAWSRKNLLEYRGQLSPSDFQELAKMQGAISKGDPDGHLTAVRGVNQLVDDTLRKLNIDPTPKESSSPTSDAAKAAKFRRAVQDQLTALETVQGKKASPEQTQQIVDAMTKEVVTGKGWLWDNKKRRFEVTIEDVPAEEKAKIIDTLTRSRWPITDANIIELFSRNKARATK